MNRDIKLAITAAVAGVATIAAASAMAADKPAQEKCFGVAAAHQNDCATATNSCAGSATKDHQADAFVYLPKGLCEKLAGGTTTAPAKKG
ncbi:MAG TPA: DUF2282 domain-containing protein [Gammaproteobacteria bacterium]